MRKATSSKKAAVLPGSVIADVIRQMTKLFSFSVQTICCGLHLEVSELTGSWIAGSIRIFFNRRVLPFHVCRSASRASLLQAIRFISKPSRKSR
jgi:hypothetical protein